MRARTRLFASAVLVLAFAAAGVGSRAQNAGVQQVPSFRSGVTAVPIDVRVIGKDGQPITDLTKDDFTILEDGVPQAIAHFTAQILVTEAPGPALRARPGAQPFDPSPQNQRVFLLVLGTRALGDPKRHPETLDALISFVRQRLLPQDQVALLAYNRATDFTTDHEKVARLLETFRRSESGARAALARQGRLAAGDAGSVFAPPETLDTSPPVESELGFEDYVRARAGQPMGELDSLFYGIKYLRHMAGEKHLVFVTERGPEPTWDQVKYLTSLASDARVALDTIQLGERVGSMNIPAVTHPGPGITQPGESVQSIASEKMAARIEREGGTQIQAGTAAPGVLGSPSGSAVFDNPLSAAARGPYDLRYVARQTGGQASMLKDAAPALARIDTATRADYLLAYYPSNGDWNGRYRSIKVLVNRPGATVLFRHGYYARREMEVFDRRRVVSDSRIESAGYQLADIRDIDVKFVPSFTKSATGRGGDVRVPLSIDVSRMAWGLDADLRHTATLEIGIYCGDSGGRIVGATRRLLNLALTDQSYERALQDRFSRDMRVAVTKTPSYVKVIVYDYDADRVGSALVKLGK